MIPKVLIIDDDRAMLRLLEKELEEYADFFSIATAADGEDALNKLSSENVSLVITDLRMPGVDGFDVLNRVIKDYPDIPVMVMTAHGKPKTKEVVMKSGAVDYLAKPVDGAKLFGRIMKALKKMKEGGSLNRISLETYLQLVEMEEQTCTLRVMNQSIDRMGVLFFKNGFLMDARIGGRRGRAAAYEILSWPGVSLSIENSCAIEKKNIDGELQAILLDAMRNKDEDDTADTVEPVDSGPDQTAPAETAPTPSEAGNKAADEPSTDAGKSPQQAKTGFHVKNTPVADESMSPVAAAGEKFAAAMGGNVAIQDIYSDPEWAKLISHVENLGQLFESGVLNVIYINRSDRQVLVVPDVENVVLLIDKDVPREGAISVFA